MIVGLNNKTTVTKIKSRITGEELFNIISKESQIQKKLIRITFGKQEIYPTKQLL